MAVALVIFIILILCWPMIKKWTARFVANRTEDYIRKATGMPPRPGSRQARQQARQNKQSAGRAGQSSRSAYSSGSSRRGKRGQAPSNEPLIPKEYAEDVEFVETINYSETIIGAASSDGRTTVYHESQVSDVEWEEIRAPKEKQSKKKR